MQSLFHCTYSFSDLIRLTWFFRVIGVVLYTFVLSNGPVLSDYAETGKYGGHMNVEGVGSIIFIIIVSYLAWYLHRNGKKIQQQRRALEKK